MLHKLFFPLLLAGLITSSFTALPDSTASAKVVNSPIKSVAIEYAYEDIKSDDVLGQQMFANKRFQVYADADFLSIKTYAFKPKPNTMDMVATWLIKDLKTNKIYTCFEVGDQKYKTNEGTDEQVSAQLFGQYTAPSTPLTKVSAPAVTIQNYLCDLWQIKQDEMVTTLYTTTTIQPDAVIKALPMFVQQKDLSMGLCLGNDTTFGPNIYKLRAQTIVIDQPQSIGTILSGFKDSSRKEINSAIKKVLGL